MTDLMLSPEVMNAVGRITQTIDGCVYRQLIAGLAVMISAQDCA
jgi:hypothetical protein